MNFKNVNTKLVFSVVFAICSGTCVFLGCEEHPDAEQSSMTQEQESEGEPHVDNVVEVEKTIAGGDAPSIPIEMRWVELQKDKAVSSDGLSLEVTNISKRDIDIDVTVISNGLQGITRLADVGKWSLSDSNKVVATMSASDIPVQVSDGAAQARMRIDLTSTSPYTGESETVSFYSSMVHYRHDTNFEKIKIFNEETLMSQFQGKIFSLPDVAEVPSAVLGRIADENGIIQEVKLAGSTFVKRAANDDVPAYDMGMLVHAGEATLEEGVE